MKVVELFWQPYDKNDPYKGYSKKRIEEILWYKEENKIYEGLITSYGIGSSMGILQRPSIRVKRGQNIYGLEGNDFSIKINLNKVLLNEIPQVLKKINTCGWFVSTIELIKNKQLEGRIKNNITFAELENRIDLFKNKDTDINFIEMYLEPKYDICIDKKFVPEALYHITPFAYKEKIKKNGLVPRSQSKSTEHPERIYLVADKSFAINSLYPDLKGRSEDYKNDPWIIITINMGRFPSHHQIFMDPNCPYAAYVLANISPYAIQEIEGL